MAHLKLQLVWIWLLIFGLNGTTICSSAASTTSQPENSVTLKTCCSADNYGTFDNSSESQFCNERFIELSWDILASYRIPKINATKALEVVDVDSSLFQITGCKNPVSLTIPIWENHEQFSLKGYFAAFNADGHLQYDQYVYSPENLCVKRFTSDAITVVACDYSSQCTNAATSKQQTFPQTSCLVRCCNYGEVWDISNPRFRCANSGELKWKPELYSKLGSDSPLNTSESPVVIFTHPRDLVHGSCQLSNYTFQSPHPQIQDDDVLGKRVGKRPFKVLQDGTVWMKLRKLEWVQLHPGEYCIDGFQFGEGNFSGSGTDSLLFECKILETSEEFEGKERQRRYSLGFGIILTFCLIFLILTAVVYMLLWSKHNIHGWTVFCYILALLVTYLLLGTSHFASISLVKGEENDEIATLCGIIGILCHFAFLSTFSWSTVLNFDLWCTFRNLRPTSGKSSGRKKFVLYCLFALAVPTAIVAVGLFLDFKYRNDVHSDVISPEYGKSVCYVEPRNARFYFVILPIAALLGINLLLFCNTAYALYKVKKSTQFASSNSTRNETGNQTFRLILKLLLINGTIWIAEIISWYLQTDYEEVGLASFILDVVNVLQAVAIFFLFVFKNDILESLKRTYPCLEGTVNAAFKLKRIVPWNRSREQGAANPNPSTSNSRLSRTIENNMPVTKF